MARRGQGRCAPSGSSHRHASVRWHYSLCPYGRRSCRSVAWRLLDPFLGCCSGGRGKWFEVSGRIVKLDVIGLGPRGRRVCAHFWRNARLPERPLAGNVTRCPSRRENRCDSSTYRECSRCARRSGTGGNRIRDGERTRPSVAWEFRSPAQRDSFGKLRRANPLDSNRRTNPRHCRPYGEARTHSGGRSGLGRRWCIRPRLSHRLGRSPARCCTCGRRPG